MSLRELLDLCQVNYFEDWVQMLGGRPATAMVAGVFDPGMKEAAMRQLEGHSIAIYEPDPRLSMVWPVPEEHPAEERKPFETPLPEWLPETWKTARLVYVVILMSGAPIWQVPVYSLNWGAGIGGFVPSFDAVFGEHGDDGPSVEGWTTTSWEISLTRLINSFRSNAGWPSHDPTDSIVPEPDLTHPVDVGRDL